jgi:hypothetical protein
MRRRLILAALGSLLLAGTAGARPPSEEELARLDVVIAELDEEIRQAAEAAREAERDKDRDFLRDYLSGQRGDRDDHKRVVDIMDNRTFDRTKPGIREQAAKVLVERWGQQGKTNTLRARKEISRRLVPLLGSGRHDDKANKLAIQVLKAFWGTDKGYNPDGSARDKKRAIEKWWDFVK